MKRTKQALAALAALAALVLTAGSAWAADRSNYCYDNPAISSDLKPNILLVLDTSESMNEPAYADYGSCDDDNGYDFWACYNNDTSTYKDDYDSSQKYPGYGVNNYWYRKNSDGTWEPVEECTNQCDPNADPPEWADSKQSDNADETWYTGNFLNFLLMTRMDMARVVLVGGQGTSRQDLISTYVTEHDEKFDLPEKDERSGVIGKVADEARWGVAATNDEDGATVSTHIGKDNLTDVRSAIQNWSASGNAPLGEALWTAAGYFAQETEASAMPGNISGDGPDYKSNSLYSTGNQSKDPFYYSDHDDYPECSQSYILLVTDGQPNADDKLPLDLVEYEKGNLDFDLAGLNSDDTVNRDLGVDNVAYYLRHTDLRPDSKSDPPGIKGTQNVLTYPVFAFGDNSTAETLMQHSAINGAFEDLDNDGYPTYVTDDCDLTGGNIDGVNCEEWDENLDNSPDAYFKAGKATNLRSQLSSAINAILERAASGSTVATIATQTRSGGTLLQAYYQPQNTQKGDAGTINLYWEGYLRSLWTDPAGNIRNEGVVDQQLVLDEDNIVNFYFDETDQAVKAQLFPDDGTDSGTAGDNIPDTCNPDRELVGTQLDPLWEVGKQLAGRQPGYTNGSVSDSNRHIWFNSARCNDSGDLSGVYDSASGMCHFNADNDTLAGVLKHYWDFGSSTYTPAEGEAESLIRYMRGYDNPGGTTTGFRLRQPDEDSVEVWDGVWKLGAVITSTPRVLRDQPVSDYADAQGSYSEFADSDPVQTRSDMIFIGGNDGMLHAFYPGEVSAASSSTEPHLTAELTGDNPGKEAWAFIPENALPYLRWYAGMDTPDCFVPTVDYRLQLIDAATGDSATASQEAGDWETLLVGTMGFGGQQIDCDFDNDTTVETLSSSVFVLDVTDPESPELLWEKSLPDHSMALTYPAVVRQASDNSLNGHWYVVAGSGPMKPEGNEFTVSANQGDPAIHIFNLRDGTEEASLSLTDTANFEVDSHAVDSGTLSTTDGLAVGEPLPFDPDQDDLTDSVFFGTYGAAGNTRGALYRLRLDGTYADSPSNWKLSKALAFADGGRPLFASVNVARDPYDNLWLYGGTGRFLGPPDQTSNANPQFVFGYMEDCWGDGANDSATCGGSPSYVTLDNADATNSDLVRVDEVTATGDVSDRECRCAGSYFGEPETDENGDYYCTDGSELVVTDTEAVDYTGGPCGTSDGLDCSGNTGEDQLASIKESIRDDSVAGSHDGWYRVLPDVDERIYSQPAVQSGLVNVLSFIPNDDLCGFGGDTNFLSVQYQTGMAPARPVFLTSSGFDGPAESADASGDIAESISLGKGVPPLGESFAAMPGTDEGEVKTMTQTSTGKVEGTTQQGQDMTQGILFVREP